MKKVILDMQMELDRLREKYDALQAEHERAIEVIAIYSSCDGYCATDECVCNKGRAQEFLASIQPNKGDV